MAFEWLKEQKDRLQSEVKKFKNDGFLNAVTASCAIVAYADGSVDAEEKQKMLTFIRMNDALKVFEIEKVIESFQKWTGQLEQDITFGKANALAAIAKVKKDESQARSVLRVAMAIADADGNTDEDEKKVLREIALELGLSPAEFEL